MERIVTSFSDPGERVVLLSPPTPAHTRPRLASVKADSTVNSAAADDAGDEPDLGVADAIAAIERLDRTVHIEYLPTAPDLTSPSARSDETGHGAGASSAPAAGPASHSIGSGAHSPIAETGAVGLADLVVISVPPRHLGARGLDFVTLRAARLLCGGGILAVLTHCDWTGGELTDPTGAIVAAGQNADLLYLQHIVAVRAPIRDGRFHLADPDPQDLVRHRSVVRGLPAPHDRIHSDVLVFAQPHQRQSVVPPPGDTASALGGRR